MPATMVHVEDATDEKPTSRREGERQWRKSVLVSADIDVLYVAPGALPGEAQVGVQ